MIAKVVLSSNISLDPERWNESMSVIAMLVRRAKPV